MNTAHIMIGPDLLIPIGTTVLYSPVVGRHHLKMKCWSIDKSNKFQGHLFNVDETTAFIIISPTFTPKWAIQLAQDDDEIWCHVLVRGKLLLFRLCLKDIVNGHVKIIDEKIS